MMLSLLALSSVVYAATLEEEEAELIRIIEDMEKFRKRTNWAAVEKKYEIALQFKKAPIPYEIHIIAAESASYSGNVAETKTRLERAIEVNSQSQATEWLGSINGGFAPVKIKVSSNYETTPELMIAEMPFFPEQQQAIAFAKAQLETNGSFKGMLPLGEYTIGSKTFSIQQGQEMQNITVAESVALAYIGPRVDVGASLGRAGQASEDDLNSIPFGGAGTRLGVGLDIGLNEKIGVITEIGYHSMMSGGETPSDDLMANFGYQATPTRYHGAFGWVAGSYNIGSIRVMAGPTMEMARVQTQGINGQGASVSTAVNSIDFMPVSGKILSCGASGGVTYYGFELGEKLNGGVSALFGAQSDSARWYSWGQVALTMNGRN